MSNTKTMTLTKTISFSALIVAVGILLPQVVHLAGGKLAGNILLPMHFTVLLSGFFLKKYWSAACGLLIPILSFFLTGMPPVPRLFFLLPELVALGILTPLFYQKLKLNFALSLALSSFLGRFVYFLSLLIGMNVFGLRLPGAISPWLSFLDTLSAGLPGMGLQLLLIPALLLSLRKGGFLHD